MTEVKREDTDNWKRDLRSAFVLGLTGKPIERMKAIVDVGRYYTCYAPISLYKYYSDDLRNLEAVKNNQMWYSAPCNFNDVFDCAIAVEEKDIFDCILRMASEKTEIRVGSQMWRKIKEITKQQIKEFLSKFDDLRTQMGITCLSETDDSLLMWAHYANNHSGICVEYELLEFNSQLHFSPVPIVYTDERVCIHTLETLTNDILGLFIESLTTKSPEWSYEKEWRIIRDDGACGNKWDNEKKGALHEATRPKSITLGCMAKTEYEKDVRQYCKENRVNLYKMEKSKENYRLEKTTIFRFEE